MNSSASLPYHVRPTELDALGISYLASETLRDICA
jgi:hypothetical protein